MRLTILGSGTSFGVPQVGCHCAVCTSIDPRDRRTRSGALVQLGAANVLVDSPPELRLQLVTAGVERLDAVLYTHAHADHVAGIDDLRIFSVRQRGTIPLYGPADTMATLERNYRYIFDGVPAHPGTSKPGLETHAIPAGVPTMIAGVPVLPLPLQHGSMTVFGYRFGGIGYVTDAKAVPEEIVAQLRGVEVLILSALWWRAHPTHLSIEEAITVAHAVGARQTFLTHLSHETGHAGLAAQLPEGIAPAYDGLTVETA
jgi:phosphoribosyl 1,2-cyclic phosphate phosphodiesterase